MKSRRHGTSIRQRSNSERQAVRKIDDKMSRQPPSTGFFDGWGRVNPPEQSDRGAPQTSFPLRDRVDA